MSAFKVPRQSWLLRGLRRGRFLQSLPGHRGRRGWGDLWSPSGSHGNLDHAHLTGDILGETILGSLTPQETRRLLRVPTGCPEQTLSSLAPVIILARYLDSTGQWNKVGVELREQVMKNIVSGESGSPPGTSMRVSGTLGEGG